jgi:hypothetical protein
MTDFITRPADDFQMLETWRAVVGHEGLYEVSSLGKVRSLPRTYQRANGSTVHLKGKVLRPWRDASSGYSRVCLSDNGKDYLERIHRLVAIAFLGPGADGEVVRHKNGDATNSSAENLEWGTESDNQFDKVRHGRHHAAAKTVCPRGHELREPNLRASVAARGWRGCLACKRAGDRRRRHPEENFDALADSYYGQIMEVAA